MTVAPVAVSPLAPPGALECTPGLAERSFLPVSAPASTVEDVHEQTPPVVVGDMARMEGGGRSTRCRAPMGSPIGCQREEVGTRHPGRLERLARSSAGRARRLALPVSGGADDGPDRRSAGPNSNVGEPSGADLAAHLARHGVRVEIKTVPGGGLAAGDAILAQAADEARPTGWADSGHSACGSIVPCATQHLLAQ